MKLAQRRHTDFATYEFGTTPLIAFMCEDLKREGIYWSALTMADCTIPHAFTNSLNLSLIYFVLNIIILGFVYIFISIFYGMFLKSS